MWTETAAGGAGASHVKEAAVERVDGAIAAAEAALGRGAAAAAAAALGQGQADVGAGHHAGAGASAMKETAGERVEGVMAATAAVRQGAADAGAGQYAARKEFVMPREAGMLPALGEVVDYIDDSLTQLKLQVSSAGACSEGEGWHLSPSEQQVSCFEGKRVRR